MVSGSIEKWTTVAGHVAFQLRGFNRSCVCGRFGRASHLCFSLSLLLFFSLHLSTRACFSEFFTRVFTSTCMLMIGPCRMCSLDHYSTPGACTTVYSTNVIPHTHNLTSSHCEGLVLLSFRTSPHQPHPNSEESIISLSTLTSLHSSKRSSCLKTEDTERT